MLRTLRTAALLVVLGAASQAQALSVIFVPPSDPVGGVRSADLIDGYDFGRGVVFSPTSDFDLKGIALYTDVSSVTVSYTISLPLAPTGRVNGGTVLREGSRVADTHGLEFVGFDVAPLRLSAGTFYFLEFKLDAPAHQNFFYDQAGSEPYSQPGFTGIDGAFFGFTSNDFLPRFRLGAVPEPGTWALLVTGFGLAGTALRRRRRLAPQGG